MTVQELKERLNDHWPQDAVVRIYDPDSEQFEPVSGFVWNPVTNEIDLYSDEG